METLESAISHMHSLGWAHNDLDSHKIMVNEQGMPVLVDFGSAREVGAEFRTGQGAKGWIDFKVKDYHISEKGNDISALGKIRKWLDVSTFED